MSASLCRYDFGYQIIFLKFSDSKELFCGKNKELNQWNNKNDQ